jgi:gliding motility-associated-like protein
LEEPEIMRKRIVFLLLLGLPFFAWADHITGGQMWYTYEGFTNGKHVYNVYLKMYMRCNSGRQFPNPLYVSVFNKTTNERAEDVTTPLQRQETISITDHNPCITNPPQVCYVVAYYNFFLYVDPSENGYFVAAQINYRIANIDNLVPGYGQIGATYTAEIPGVSSNQDDVKNNSAQFTGSDLVVICAKNSFIYSFAATDADGDELRYSFCNAYITNGGGGRGNDGAPATPPPYPSVPYGPSFSGTAPLGDNVKIDAATGLITGKAPGEGKYVVTVCVQEIRNGRIIATQRKDLQINITDCAIAAASLLPDYQLCDTSKTLAISNQSNSPLISTYNWEFFDHNGQSIFASTSSSPSYTFADTGTYSVKLVINKNGPCSDSTVAPALVYPGLKTSFNVTGICISKPSLFADASTSVYGTINSWDWSFGDNGSPDNNSQNENATHTYNSTGTKLVQLSITDSKGCRSFMSKPIGIIDRPPIRLAFGDTLICINDKVPLLASGNGLFSWSPQVNMINANTANPTVSPAVTTTYYVQLNQDGCINKDSVKVNVVDHVTLQAMNDTIICSGDAIQLRLSSDGLHYIWTPASQLNDATLTFPTAITPVTTNYQVTAVIGSCTASDFVNVKAVPYPLADAGNSKMICYQASVQLNGSTDGSSYSWSPPESLNNSSVLNPVATPPGTTAYVLSAFDTKGCPKPGTDTILITVLPDINAFAGRDTAVVMGQPLQFEATGGVNYSWFPSTGLSSYAIANPVGIYSTPSTGIQYKVYVYNEANCVDSAFVKVKVYATKPTVFVPTAFTPNSDGRNDKLRPIAAGIKDIEYFSIYNRWGQLVFSTRVNGEGWDGTIGGQAQQTGTFVWVVKATDYNGDAYFQKGVTTLIR